MFSKCEGKEGTTIGFRMFSCLSNCENHLNIYSLFVEAIQGNVME
jgi:hypothetical protein